MVNILCENSRAVNKTELSIFIQESAIVLTGINIKNILVRSAAVLTHFLTLLLLQDIMFVISSIQ